MTKGERGNENWEQNKELPVSLLTGRGAKV